MKTKSYMYFMHTNLALRLTRKVPVYASLLMTLADAATVYRVFNRVDHT